MTKPERAIVIIFRLIGGCGLFAIPAIFLPYSWMNAVHEYVGLGELPDAPIVSYLARSLATFYAAASVVILFVSFDIRRYRSFVKLFAVIFVAIGFVLLGIDVAVGMPTSWTLSEGPRAIVVGLLILWLQQKIPVGSDGHHER